MDERIFIDPEIQHGKPVIRGTRIPVTRIIGGLAGGMTREEIMREYEVTEEDIRAALSYAADLIEAEADRLGDVRAERALYVVRKSHDSYYWTGSLTKIYPFK